METTPEVAPVTIKSENTPTTTQPPAKPLVKSLEPTQKGNPVKTLIIVLLLIGAGIGSGYGLNLVTAGGAGGIKSTTEVTEGSLKVGDVVGSTNEKDFPNDAEGVLVVGGIDGEGSHHLLRPGGPDQTAYLTSSVVDLNLFVGHKIQVWGETFAGQKAGWLMDVGRVRVVELNAPKPFEEEKPETTQE